MKLRWFMVAVIASSLVAATSEAVLSAETLPKDVVKVSEIEGITEYRLGNGLQVLLLPDNSKPTVTVSITYRVGSRMEDYGETGMAHLLEHLTFKSTRNIANVGQELSKRGIGFNGNTSYDRTIYFENFPSDADKLDWVLGIEAERMTWANIAKADLDSEMTVVRNEMESGENNSFGVLSQKMLASAFQWHSYGKSTIGARSDVENVKIPHLQNFYKKFYQPDNATLMVAGKFAPAHALNVIARNFGALPKPARVIEATYTQEPVQEGEREVVLRRPGGEQWIGLLYHLPADASAETAALNVVSSALGDTPNGRLHKNLVEAGKAQAVFARAESLAEAGYMLIGAKLRPGDNLGEAQKILLDTVEGLQLKPVTEVELSRSKQQMATDYERLLDNPQALAIEIGDAVADGDWRLVFLDRDRMKALQLAEVNRVAAAWLKPSNRTLGLFVPTDHPDRAPLVDKPDIAAQMKEFKPGKAVAEGEEFIATPENIDMRTEHVTLPSGLKLLLLPKKTRGETVVLSLRMHFGNEANLRGQRPAGNLVAQMLERGTTKHTRKQLSDASDAIQTNLSVSGGLSGASASVQTKRQHLAQAIQLLAELLREPSFPPDEFTQLKKEIDGNLESGAKEPRSIADLAIKRYLHPYASDDSRYTASIEEYSKEIDAAKLEDVKNFHLKYWGMDHAEIAVVGDFDPKAVQAQLSELFGDWKSSMLYQRIPNQMTAATAKMLVAETPDKQNAVAIGSIALPLRDVDADFPALSVAGHVFGSGFDSRLLSRLRQKDGLSYSAGGGISASGFSEPYGQLNIGAIYAPQNRDKVESDFADELQRWVRDGITADELANAKRAMATQFNTMYASDGAQASVLLERTVQGRTLAYDSDLQKKIAALGLDQVNAAIRKWIKPETAVWSLAGDFAKADCKPPTQCGPTPK